MAPNIQKAVQQQQPEAQAKKSVKVMLDTVLDGEGYRKRFNELLGDRTAQFLASLMNMINDNESLREAFEQSPMSVVKSALQAASYDLPIDPTLGYAYIVPFNNKVKGKTPDGKDVEYYKKQAQFIIGYKGMIQLCLRTGAYQSIPEAVDVREGELVSYNRLTGDADFNWIEDEDERETKPIVGYAGYLRLKNGAEKTIYMSKKQIEAHERKHRKGQYMGKGWKENYDAMARKTVIRRLCSHYALMSIQYQNAASEATTKLAEALTAEEYPADIVDYTVDESTGEVVNALPESAAIPVDNWMKQDLEGATLPFDNEVTA